MTSHKKKERRTIMQAKKETVFDLSKFVEKQVQVKFTGGREGKL